MANIITITLFLPNFLQHFLHDNVYKKLRILYYNFQRTWFSVISSCIDPELLCGHIYRESPISVPVIHLFLFVKSSITFYLYIYLVFKKKIKIYYKFRIIWHVCFYIFLFYILFCMHTCIVQRFDLKFMSMCYIKIESIIIVSCRLFSMGWMRWQRRQLSYWKTSTQI